MTPFERFARDARAAVALAQQEAGELGDPDIGPAHLLVGVVQSAGRGLAAVLGECGMTVDVLRARLAEVDRDDDSVEFEADAEAMRAIGIDLYAVRDKVIRNFGADAFDAPRSGRRRRRRGTVPLDRAAKKAIELGLRETLAHRSRTLDCPLLLLGILDSGDPFTLGLIAEHVEVSRLRAAVEGLLDEAA